MEIKARMPGIILEIKVKPGDHVYRREILGYLEAMKMEQPILSPKEGDIQEITAEQGLWVKRNQVLMTLEPSGEARNV